MWSASLSFCTLLTGITSPPEVASAMTLAINACLLILIQVTTAVLGPFSYAVLFCSSQKVSKCDSPRHGSVTMVHNSSYVAAAIWVTLPFILCLWGVLVMLSQPAEVTQQDCAC